MQFNEELLDEKDFLKQLRKAHDYAYKLASILEELKEDWELDEEDEELINDLHEKADELQSELYDSYNDD